MEPSSPHTPSPLQLVWPEACLSTFPGWITPDRYRIKPYEKGDEEAILELLFRTGFPAFESLESETESASPIAEGFIFATDLAQGQPVAMIMAVPHRTPDHPHGDEIGWLWVAPEHRGHGLGSTLLAAATEFLVRREARDIYLKVEETQLKGIQIYLRLGYFPLLQGEEATERWKNVCQRLDWPFAPEVWPICPVQ